MAILKPVLAALALLAASWSPGAAAHEGAHEPPDGTVGLVRLPMLFGDGACDRFPPGAVALYRAPGDRKPIGEVRVTRPWAFAADGGCSGLEVQAFVGTRPAEPLPTLELGYERPAGIVLARSGPWCRLQLRSGSAWIRDGCEAGFLPVQDLLREQLLTLRPGALDLARRTPGGAPQRASRALREATDLSVNLLSTERVGGAVWLQVTAAPGGPCDGAPPQAGETFWLPLHGAAGRLPVWFHARGC